MAADADCRKDVIENVGNGLQMGLWGVIFGVVGYAVVAAISTPDKLKHRPKESRGKLFGAFKKGK